MHTVHKPLKNSKSKSQALLNTPLEKKLLIVLSNEDYSVREWIKSFEVLTVFI